MRASRFLLILLLAPLALVSACNRGVRPAQLNIPAPDFTVSDGSTTVHLAGYRGQVVLLNFWWSECAPCIEELPSLLQLHRDMPDLVILAVSIDEDAGAYKRFLAERHIDLITVRNPTESAPKLFHTDMWPETYLIDRHGIIRSKFIGAQDWSSPQIRALLKSL